MAGYRTPGSLGTGVVGSSEGRARECVAGFAPGSTLATPAPVRTRHGAAQPAAPHKARLTTDVGLLAMARTVRLAPARNRCVFYAENEGVARATAFVAVNPGHTRLDELLAQTPEGQQLWAGLVATPRPWSDMEEVWWELSYRLARAASGVVQVFGPARLVEDRPIEEFRHEYQHNAYANTVFEKVEWPELEQNPKVTSVYYNGALYAPA